MPPTMPQARTVLVTGAAKRLGRAIALEMARGGWQVALHYGQSQDEARATAAQIAALNPSHGDAVALFQGDLADTASVQALFAAVVDRFGTVQGLVNSASQFEHDDPRSFDPALAQRLHAVNCVAPLLLTQALHRHLEGLASAPGQAVQGSVVNLLDQKLWNLNPDFLSYTLSKAALQSATTMMAQAFGPVLRVCGVAPGLTEPSYLQDQAAFERTHRLSPLGRSSQPDDVARTVRFVLENPSMTGTQVLVDGGQHLMHLPRDVSFL